MKKSCQCLTTATVAILLAIACSPLFAGVVFQVETTYHSGNARGPESAQMSVEEANIKMEILPRGESSAGTVKDEMVFRGDRRQMVVVDHREKSYMVMDTAAVERVSGQVQGMQGQMGAAMKEAMKRLEQLDPKQREMMEKMLKERMPGDAAAMPDGIARSPSEYRKTSERASKQGYLCVRYDVFRDGEKVREVWVTDWDNVQGGVETLNAFKEMKSFYEELMDSFAGMTGGFFDPAENPIESYFKVDGFPVVTRSFEGGELESETVLESATERDLDPDAFEPPKGYRLRTMGPQ